MNFRALDKLQTLKSTYSGYQALFDYHLRNLCIKAEPVSFLSIQVITDFGLEDFEEVAMIAMDPDDKFAVDCYVKDQRNFKDVMEGILRSHPEFKLQPLHTDDREKATLPDDLDSGRELYLRITMPYVDDNRYDLLNDAVDKEYDEMRAKVDKAHAELGTQALNLAKTDKETMDKVKPQVEDLYDNTKDTLKKLRDDKRTEIEEGHQRYLHHQGEKQGKQSDGLKNVGQSLSME